LPSVSFDDPPYHKKVIVCPLPAFPYGYKLPVPFIMSGIVFLPLQLLLIAIDLAVSDQRYSFNLGATNDSKFFCSLL